MSSAVSSFLARFAKPHRNSNGWMVQCPAHDDRTASLSVSEGDDGRVLLKCHAGCDVQSICAALNMEFSDLFDTPQTDGRRIVATYDYQDRDGTLLFQVVRFQPKDFRQRCPDGHGDWKWSLKGVPRVLYRLPVVSAARLDERIFIVEGEKDADTLLSLGVVSTTCPGGAMKWKHLSDDSALNGHPVTIIADKDGRGRKHAQDVARRLYGRVSEISIVELPGGGKDATDWVRAGGTRDELLAIVAQAELFEPGTPTKATESSSSAERPTIIIGADEHRVIDEVIDALNRDSELFQRGGRIVRIASRRGIRQRSSESRTHSIEEMPKPSLRERITRFVELLRDSAFDGLLAAHPPAWLVAGVFERSSWPGVRDLTGLSSVPILRADGSICQTPGFDEETGVLYVPQIDFPEVHPEVDIDDASASLDVLTEVIHDFRFASDAHRSAWLAGLLTPLARHAFEGPSPLFLIDANIRGAGKGLLANTIGMIVDGHPMPVHSYSHDSEEMRKKITTIAVAGEPTVLLDNLAGVFGNDALDRALTTTRWKDRLLKTNLQADVPMLTCWFGTGNNVIVGADTARRIVHIRLDVLEERPEERSDFLHKDLLRWVKRNRPQLLISALTILRAYFNAGCPAQDLSPYGSFEGWSDLVRSAVVWCGWPDPCESRIELLQSSDNSASIIGEVLTAWQDVFSDRSVTIREVLETINPDDSLLGDSGRESVEALRGAIGALLNLPHGKRPAPRQLANRLKSVQRRVVNDQMLDVDKSMGKGRHGAFWKLHVLSECDSVDSGDSVGGDLKSCSDEIGVRAA